jgi:energy-coupling factor transport system permease protein
MLFYLNIAVMQGGFIGAAGVLRAFFMLLPLGLLLIEKKWKAAFLFAIFGSAAVSVELFLVHRSAGILNIALVIAAGLFSRFVPGFVMGYYLFTTTKVSELIAALERLRISPKIIIPFAVMMRFFPTIAEEYGSIKDSMRMRGIYFGGGRTLKIPEYRIVPLLMSAVKIGEELSAAALTRGLGKPVKRTNICRSGFGAKDFVFLFLCLGVFTAWAYCEQTGR